MRKGFTIVELLILIIIIPFVYVLIDGLFRTLLTDIPSSCRIVQENTTLLNMLAQIQQDMDKAKSLPELFAGQTASEKSLLIELEDSVICYQIEDGRVLRHKLTDTYEGSAEQRRVWSLPNAKVKWRILQENGRGHAVETETHIPHKSRGRWEKKMANSHLYFVGAL